ncbi:MAG TPA: phosphoenolpyruvate--protein phosphotransferase [Desulfobulbaceae bacterium]|nr:phosphoenolpyruvate--protein phosphotransferase [Desulfobulbaceae bacterium]
MSPLRKKNILSGISVSDGIGIGQVIVYRTDFDDVSSHTLEPMEVPAELERYSNALQEVSLIFLNNQKRIARELGLEQARIYETYHLILDDPFFQEEIPQAIRGELKNAEAIIVQKLGLYEKHFSTIDDEYLRERIYDIRGVSRRLIYHLLQLDSHEQKEGESCIVVARELTPADSIHFHHRSLKGLVTEFGGPTSHAAILARSLEVPAIVGVRNLLKNIKPGMRVILDGLCGKLIVEPRETVVKDYLLRKQAFQAHKEELIANLEKKIENLSGRNIRLLANINEVSEVPLARKYKAQGVGLYRTELQFIAKERLLSEEEQFGYYREIARSFADSDVAIRVLDLGGDKFLPFAEMHREANPFLGLRSIRILLRKPAIFRTQIRAILRASVFGHVKIMLPMISSREEVLAAKRIIRDVCRELDAEGIAYDKQVPVGIMVEIPSAALLIDQLLPEVDFVSIGTNDLVQYTLAVDRNNEKVASFYKPLNPAVLQLIHKVSRACIKKKKPLSLCGEIAGNPLYTQLLLSLGVDTLSMQPGAIAVVKNVIRNTTEDDLKEIRARLFRFKRPESLEKYLRKRIEHFL